MFKSHHTFDQFNFAKFINVDKQEIFKFIKANKIYFYEKDYFEEENKCTLELTKPEPKTELKKLNIICKSGESFQKFLDFIGNKDVLFGEILITKNNNFEFLIKIESL